MNGATAVSQSLRGLLRIGRSVLIALAVAASLITFPNAIPWMVAFWLAWHTLVAARGGLGWLPLLTCAFVLIAKRVDWPPGLAVLGALMVFFAGLKGRMPAGRLSTWVGILTLWLAWTAMAVDWHRSTHCTRSATLDPNRPVVCIGDSLTACGYPKRLRETLSIPVVDLSCNGINSRQALDSLPNLITAIPQAVVIEIGGHDYLQGHTRAATKENIEKLIDASEELGAEVILVEVPRGLITDPFAGLEREIARHRGLELVPDTLVRRLILWSPAAPPGLWLPRERHLSDDSLHPNARGNRLFAEYVAEALARIYGPGVRNDAGGE
jgi:lysophospholipase L1-like esterase